MVSWLIIPVVALAGSALLILGRFAKRRPAKIGNAAIASNLVYQPISVLVALVTLALASVISARPMTTLLVPGNLKAKPEGLDLLGVTEQDTWASLGLTFLVIMSVVTTLTVWLQIGRNSRVGLQQVSRVLPAAIGFSAVNAFVEEVVFRVALVQGMSRDFEPWQIAVASAVLFGIPHYFGNPRGFLGVALAGFMGWFLSFSVIQTQGIAIAFGIHFVQDVVILSAVFAASSRVGKPL